MNAYCGIVFFLAMMASSVLAQSPEEISPFKGLTFYADPYSLDAQWVKDNPQDPNVKAVDTIAQIPKFVWLGGWDKNPQNKVKDVVRLAHEQKQIPQLLVYNRPKRDAAGQHSKGGAADISAYRSWIDNAESGLYETDWLRQQNKDAKVIVVIEPDGVAEFESLKTEEALAERRQAIKYATTVWVKHESVYTYIDFGHAQWLDNPARLPQAISFLISCGVQHARGISINTSNFRTTEECIAFGEKVCAELERRGLGRKFYIIDTSRNGKGPDPKNEPYNPQGRGLGELPTGDPQAKYPSAKHCDALVWIKDPAQSDGDHNPGDPKAGEIFSKYAAELVNNRANK